ncbi:MAG: hypothetical protein C0403_07885, partial [Desulfobacterium sp.]|nr:hypothetical protein [Desulfobacterium sp.]
RSDYIWVSGIWRIPPPGRQWVPGFWDRSGEGFQWTSGYWITIQANEAKYLPEPPDSIEIGPDAHAPSSDYGWIPGCWIWHHNRYAWRPGFWAKMHRDWIWIPAHYSWTPSGYIFVSGYWDLIAGKRGVLYAPVYVSPNMHRGVVFSYSPGHVVNLNVFSDCLFLRPGYRHYYFGDYYAPRYYRKGFYPWFSNHARRSGYDPIYAHQRWHHRNDNDWEHHLQSRFQERREHEAERPSRRPEFGRGQHPDKNNSPRTGNVTTDRFSPVRRSIDSSVRLKPMDKQKRSKINQIGKAVRTYREDSLEQKTQIIDKPMNRSRGIAEPNRVIKNSRTYGPGHIVRPNRTLGTGRTIKTNRIAEPIRVKSGRPLINARPVNRITPENTLPNRYKLPKTDFNVKPLERTSDAIQMRSRGNSLSNVRKQSYGTGIQTSKVKKSRADNQRLKNDF